MSKKLFGLFIFALSVLGIPGTANAVLIDISGASFTPGTGYGIDASETSSPTLLDVRFSTSIFTAQNFNLNSVGDSRTFDFGTANFSEPDSGGGIAPAETNDLDVTANFVFTSPLGVTKTVSAAGVATTGSVSDSAVDYTLDWTPLVVDFGVGGQFQIDLLDLSFTTRATKTITATITLLSLPAPPAVQVPEPGTVGLFIVGLIGIGLISRRRKNKFLPL